MAITKISTDGYKDESVDLTKLPHGDANNNGKFLRANNGADPTFETVNTDVAGDSTPQLGGNLDVNGNDIVSVSNADIDIVPHGSGKTNLGGVSGVKLPVGDTSERVNVTALLRYNSDTGLPEYYNGSTYISIDSPPAVSSITPTEVDSTAGGNVTFTVTGARFSVGCTVKFISNTGTQLNAISVTRDSATQLTVVVAKSSFVNAQEPYTIKVTNASGLAAELADQINVDSDPTWTTAAGTLGNVTVGNSESKTVAATDSEGDSILYSLLSGAFPGGMSLNATTGVISGTVSGSAATFTFALRATANSKNVDRTFNIVVFSAPTGGTQVTYTYGGVTYRLHIFTNNGTFTRQAVSTVDILVVGGGGGAGFGGGGAGALVWGTSKTLTDASYAVSIGSGGNGTGANSANAIAGQDSSFGSLVVAEGGGPGGRRPGISGGNSNSGPGGDGGSGGGGGHPDNIGGSDANNGSGGLAVTGSSTGGTVYGNNGGAGFNCCNGGGGGGAGEVGQAGVGDPGSGENRGGNGHSTFVGDAASTAAMLFAADLGTDGSSNATSGLSSNPGTLYLAGGGGGAYGSPRGGYGGGGVGGVSSGNTSGRSHGLDNSGSGGGGANSVGMNGGSGVVVVRYVI